MALALSRQFGMRLQLCVSQSTTITVGKSSCQQCIRNWLPRKVSPCQQSFVHNNIPTACWYRQFVTLTKHHGSQLSRLPSQESRVIRHFKVQTSKGKEPVESGQSIFKPVMFTVAVCSGSFFLASVVYKYRVEKELEAAFTGPHDQFVRKAFVARNNFNQVWNMLTDVQKSAYIIIAINTAVFMLWRVPSLIPVMTRYFTCSPGNPMMSMVLSTFSHHSGVHLFVNMYVLHSFTSALKMDFEEFWAFYISAGTVSSLTSMVNKIGRGLAVPSVGASGAIMALIGLFGIINPDGRVAIAFVNQIIPHSFSIWEGITGVIAFDTIGLVLGWKFLDHAGHLGGMMTGLFYAKFGKKLWLNLPAVKSAKKSIRDSYW